jgi:sn-1 stearoyl-lipid 9-desaturase
MAFIDILIEPPSYGWQNDKGELIKPSKGELIREAFRRMNIFKSRKNFLGFFGWFEVLCLIPFFLIFFIKFFSIKLLICGFVYGMVCMGTHGTIWYHRYSTHRAFTFKNKFWMFITRNLSLTNPETHTMLMQGFYIAF